MNDTSYPGVIAVDHVGIAVPDLDEAVAFHRDVFGWRVTHTETSMDAGVREAMVRAPGDGGAGTAIQLFAPLRQDCAVARFLDRHGPGLQQLAYRVTDVAAVCEALRARGMRMLYTQPQRGAAGSRVNFISPRDAGGVLVELVQPAAGAGPRR